MSVVLSIVRSSLVKAGKLSDQLDQRHLCRVTLPIPQLENPCVAAGALHVPRGDVVEKLPENLPILDLRRREASRVKVTASRQSNQTLCIGPQLFRLGRRRLDPFVPKERGHHIPERRLTVAPRTGELPPFLTIPHLLLLAASRGFSFIFDEEETAVFALLELHAKAQAVLFEEVGDFLE